MLKQKDIDLLKKPNVNIIFEGNRTKNNIKTDEKCVVVGVTEKKPKEEIPEDELISEDKDVIEIQPFTPLNTQKHRPIIGGISGHDYNTNTPTLCGTLGLIVKDNTTNNLIGLTNNHCVGLIYDDNYSIPDIGFPTLDNRYFSQPSIGDGAVSSDIIGSPIRTIPIKFGNIENNLIDAAVISINENLWFTIKDLTDDPVKFYESPIWEGALVSKAGRTTGLTENGVVDQTEAAISISFYDNDNDNNKAVFTDQILISGSGFSGDGDSGSVILLKDSHDVIGLLFAGNGDYTIANKITNIVNLLDISAWNGEIIIPYNDDYLININNRTFSKIKNSEKEPNFTPF